MHVYSTLPRKLQFSIFLSYHLVIEQNSKSNRFFEIIRNLLVKIVETPRKFIIAELSIRKLGSSSVLIILRIECSAIINLRGVSTSLTSILYSPCKRTRNLSEICRNTPTAIFEQSN